MSGIDLRDDRIRGVLKAVEGGEVLGHVLYFVRDAPESALGPAHTAVASVAARDKTRTEPSAW
ncbi:hypothetical protein [Streptomyces sp. NPDC005865]|uniref:hypothetical protein n=1 Tax=Streptomyces sp. NPDC005865 TaxID=3155453 RepID=UPI0033EF03BD